MRHLRVGSWAVLALFGVLGCAHSQSQIPLVDEPVGKDAHAGKAYYFVGGSMNGTLQIDGDAARAFFDHWSVEAIRTQVGSYTKTSRDESVRCAKFKEVPQPQKDNSDDWHYTCAFMRGSLR